MTEPQMPNLPNATTATWRYIRGGDPAPDDAAFVVVASVEYEQLRAQIALLEARIVEWHRAESAWSTIHLREAVDDTIEGALTRRAKAMGKLAALALDIVRAARKP